MALKFKAICKAQKEAKPESREESPSPPPAPPRRFATPVIKTSVAGGQIGIKRLGADLPQPRTSSQLFKAAVAELQREECNQSGDEFYCQYLLKKILRSQESQK